MTYFAFCIHNHQPVGNFPSVLEEAYEKSYWPFLKALARHPAIKLTLHNSGFLLDWIAACRQEYVELLTSMVKSGQVEIMGGGYYEPILSVIPEADRIGQIRLMSDKIEAAFGVRPAGAWLAERVWEPFLPSTLKAAGVEYLLVDDFHFIKSGLSRPDLGGYYVTEDQGNAIKVLPGSEALRYLIPFKPVAELKTHLSGLKGFLRRGNAAIYGDDGEKFGVWPGTEKWVFTDGWLEAFFSEIEANLAWLKPVTLGGYVKAEEPLGRVYLPTTSYMEMGGWALPPEAARAYGELADDIKKWNDGGRVSRFMQGGAWRNFLAKYPESNWMHKRMLGVSRMVEEAGRAGRDTGEATHYLYKAQSNDAYWHGVFGGLYLPHLRTSVYENLLKAEGCLGGKRAVVSAGDIDADGHDEVRLSPAEANLFISPRNGGSLVELDYLPKAVNLGNTLARWREGYHHKLAEGSPHGGDAKSIHDVVLVKEAGLERYLKFDARRRVSFVDHFLGPDATPGAFFANAHVEHGGFVEAAYEAMLTEAGVILSRDAEAGGGQTRVAKEYRLTGDASFSVAYSVSSAFIGALRGNGQLRFGVEMNLLLPCCDGPACYYEFAAEEKKDVPIGLGGSGELSGVSGVRLVDTYTGVALSIEVDAPCTLWRFPVYTVSLSEAGFEKIYQGSCLVFLFALAPEGLEAAFNIKAGGA
ncbi:MAG: DUF1926 domain-containing protein [Deltaproteobacteria bacterium]|nr:DUF1926 domain-containing protein [Deltaproteobacteria bacterium]